MSFGWYTGTGCARLFVRRGVWPEEGLAFTPIHFGPRVGLNSLADSRQVRARFASAPGRGLVLGVLADSRSGALPSAGSGSQPLPANSQSSLPTPSKVNSHQNLHCVLARACHRFKKSCPACCPAHAARRNLSPP
ncbi:hypothetical protein T484DRAFT_1933164 [Baffinella frigidus]|nr:hypothetical protein T484DRAFT_1933164 [Cryptophyta sp. CCMP2293]